jgi:small subunit ribosomal protein S16
LVKIRLKRQGNKHRPFYRIIVAEGLSPRDGRFIEIIGTYNPVQKDPETGKSIVTLDKAKALNWLLQGATPTETVAYILKREGVMEEFLAQRPKAAAKFKFLDKRTSAMSQASVVGAPSEEAAEAAE